MNFDDKTVYILDSYGLIYRCYFAFINRPLTNSKGQNISALFGFFRNLHYIFKHYSPGCLLAAMDSKTKTFRHQFYEEYKANRDKTPEDLHAQIPWICDILKALNIPVLQCDGYEADDIIATVAKKCQESGRTCRILSGDKDLMQLVTESTQILKPETGASTWKVTTSQGVKAEWGVEPTQLLDLLSLFGDSADNIPGVKGIGVKTAAKLLTEYENLDGIYNHIDSIKGAVQKKLIDGKENAYFSQKLVRLCDSVPCPQIDSAINACETSWNFSAAAELLKGFEAYAVAKSYAELETDKSENPINDLNDFNEELNQNQLKENDRSLYRAITNLKDLENYVDRAIALKTVAYDSETDSLNTLEANIIGFSLCCEEGKGVYVPLKKDEEDLFNQTEFISPKDAFTQITRLFTAKDVKIIMHNAKFDLKVLLCQMQKINQSPEVDYSLLNINLSDTMILAWLLNPERQGKTSYGLEYLCQTMLGLKGIEFKDIVAKGQTFADVPLEKAYEYAAEDADFTLKLYKKLNEKWEEECRLHDKVQMDSLLAMEMKLLPVLVQMEITGIHLDRPNLYSYKKELESKIEEARKNIYKEVGHEFNVDSPKQLQTVLFEERGLKPGKKTKTGYSTDTSVLEELSLLDKVPKMILEYREMAKLLSTYVQTLPEMADKNGRIHTDFVQTGTATGRLSCREPNLQNIPVRSEAGRKIRGAFTAPEGKVLISADYSQIELVVLAHLSKDPNMCKAFNEGTDVHRATAALIYGIAPEEVTQEMRRTAKTINFGVIYGMSAFSLAKDLGISRTEAQNFIDMYFKTYSSVASFMNQVIQDAEEKGYAQTISGRRRPILNINSKNKMEKAAAERIAKNTPVQGSAADIVKTAMILLADELKSRNSPAKLLLQVHDELILECPNNQNIIEESISIIKDKMENAVKLSVPLKVSIEYGKNWGEFH